jgi:leucine dehydrogenase
MEQKDTGLLFEHRSFDNHEQVVFCSDKATGLKAIIGIHDTTLGPALGGTRMWNYTSEADALTDVLRLSRGMTYKAAITGLDLGGGKAVIIGDAKTQKTDELMRKFASYVHSLGGRYITAEDMGMETRDMDIVKEVTPYVTGVSEELGGAGNPSPVTAYGVFMGLKAAVKYRFGSDDLIGKKVLVQGVGHVGEDLVRQLTEEGALVTICDINKENLAIVSAKYGATIHQDLDTIYSLDVDIYAPCAMGATINDDTIAVLKAKVIAGAANNQLADEVKHGQLLRDKNIAYAPDFLINAGGIINVYAEIVGFTREEIMQKTANIYNTTLDIFALADEKNISTQAAAIAIAKARIAAKKENQKIAM